MIFESPLVASFHASDHHAVQNQLISSAETLCTRYKHTVLDDQYTRIQTHICMDYEERTDGDDLVKG